MSNSTRYWLPYVAGQFCDAQHVETIKSPWDSTPAGEAKYASPVLLEKAIESAVAVARTQFRQPRHEKARQCQAVAYGIRARGEELAQLIMRESGKPIQYARGEVERAIITFTLGAHEALRFAGEALPLDISAAGDGLSGRSERVPLGPVAAISPFNFPLNLVAHKISPALAVGVPLVLKPAVQTPLTALKLAEIIDEARVLPGSVSIMPMSNETSEQMVRDERLRVLSFTGSVKVGWHLKSISGRKRVLLELGGNAPVIVHADADVDWAVERLVPAGFAAAGQVCIKAQRILVHRSIYALFAERFVEAATRLQVGDPADDRTVVGPVIDVQSAERIMQWVSEAVDAGAKVLCGHSRDGNIVMPTVLENVPPNSKCMREEIFGPVVVLQEYDDLSEAIRLANDTDYGLQAAVFSYDVRVIDRAASELEYGGIIINDSPMLRVDNYPYGGAKASGLGREGVRYAMEEYTQPKVIIQRHR